MKLLKKIQQEEELSTMRKRDSVRGVIFNSSGDVALNYVSKYDFYSLPGGGVDEGEDNITALKRECLEEVGAEIDNINEIGKTIEVYEDKGVINNSYAYSVDLIGDIKEPELTEEEKESGYKTVWASIDEAIRLVSSNTEEIGRQVREMNVAILNEVKRMTTKPLTNEYEHDGVKYIFEYYDADSFDDLPHEMCEQAIAIAFHGEKFLIVNNINHPDRFIPIGGGIEKGETPEECMVREIKEESNMKVLEIKPIGYQKVTALNGEIEPFYQLRYFCIVEPYGPFVEDPDGDVTEVIECDPKDYKKYFDWGEIGDRIMERAVEMKGE